MLFHIRRNKTDAWIAQPSHNTPAFGFIGVGNGDLLKTRKLDEIENGFPADTAGPAETEDFNWFGLHRMCWFPVMLAKLI